MGVDPAKQKQDFGDIIKIQFLWKFEKKSPNPQRGAMKWYFTPREQGLISY
jgi:hypothetical protein